MNVVFHFIKLEIELYNGSNRVALQLLVLFISTKFHIGHFLFRLSSTCKKIKNCFLRVGQQMYGSKFCFYFHLFHYQSRLIKSKTNSAWAWAEPGNNATSGELGKNTGNLITSGPQTIKPIKEHRKQSKQLSIKSLATL